MKTAIPLGALFLLVLVGGFYYANQSTSTYVPVTTPVATTTDSGTATSSPTATTTTSGPTGYTAAQIAMHNTAASCWTSIGGNVYDLTSWINEHPGGEAAILSLCGRDGTSAFEAQHGRDPRAQSILSSFKIGVLAS